MSINPVFVVRLTPAAGSDGIKELRLALKAMLRRGKLRCLSVHEEPPEWRGEKASHEGTA